MKKSKKPLPKKTLIEKDERLERTKISNFAVVIHEVKRAGILSEFESVVKAIGDSKNDDYKTLVRYINDARTASSQLETAKPAKEIDFNLVNIDLKDLGVIQKHIKSVKRELSKLILEKYGSYVEFAKKADLQPSNLSKFFNANNTSKPRIATMLKMIELLGVEEIQVRKYADD